MIKTRVAVLAVAVAAVTMTGCTSQRFSSLNTRSTTIAEPLEPAPAGIVTADTLPPPGGINDPVMFPDAPGADTNQLGGGVQVASANAANITTSSVAGVWNATVAGQGCRVATPQTKFGQGFRAGPLRCPAPLDGVKSWNVEGKQLALYDQSGGVLARLYSTGGERFDGQMSNGLPISLSR